MESILNIDFPNRIEAQYHWEGGIAHVNYQFIPADICQTVLHIQMQITRKNKVLWWKCWLMNHTLKKKILRHLKDVKCFVEIYHAKMQLEKFYNNPTIPLTQDEMLTIYGGVYKP